MGIKRITRQHIAGLAKTKNMAVYFKVIKRPPPGAKAKEGLKYQALTVTRGELSLDTIAYRINKSTSLNQGLVMAAMYALERELIYGLADGQIVRLGRLGSMHIKAASSFKETEKEASAKALNRPHIIFSPGPELKNMLKTLKYKKIRE